MLSEKEDINFWDKYVNVGSAKNGFLKGLLTGTSLLLKIEDKKREKENNEKRCIVYTQSLNMRNLNNHIASIARASVSQGNGFQFNISGGDEDDNKHKLMKYETKYNNLELKE